MDYDMIVIGGGAGGMAASRAAVRRGARTLLVQQGPIGGDCTFTGCVPSKAVIEAAARREPFAAAMASARRAVTEIAAWESDETFRREGVEVLHGWARFRSPREVEVDGRVLTARHFVIATGAGPAVPPVDGLRRLDFLTNENVFELETMPASLAVLGGGPIGCELAQAFGRLGAAVTVVQGADRLLPREEPEASQVVVDAFRAEGVQVRLGHRVVRVDPLERKGAARLHLDDGDSFDADRVLVAAGRRASTAELGLDAAGVETDRGFVKTDDHLATNVAGIWAVGDIAGKLQFTHAADEMGRIVAGNALSKWPKRRFRASWIPWVTYTSPEVARVGITEAEAAERGGRVAYLPMAGVDRAVAAGETQGFIKLIAGPRPVIRNVAGGEILGATVVAARGGEVIHEVVLAMRANLFTARLAQAVHAYPTWSSAVQKAAAQFFVDVEGRRAKAAGKSDSA